MAAILEIRDYRTRLALFGILSVILGLSNHSSNQGRQGRKEFHVYRKRGTKKKDLREQGNLKKFCG